MATRRRLMATRRRSRTIRRAAAGMALVLALGCAGGAGASAAGGADDSGDAGDVGATVRAGMAGNAAAGTEARAAAAGDAAAGDAVAAGAVAAGAVAGDAVAAAAVLPDARESPAAIPARAWVWPVAAPFRLDAPYVQPAHAYGPGHRGIDILPLGATEVRAPDAGVVAFAGTVVDRAVVTIDHGGGLVSTLEPVTTALAAGERVTRGETVGELALGGHTRPGRLHLGARLHGEYVNPMLLLGGVPRAVLLPCCQ